MHFMPLWQGLNTQSGEVWTFEHWNSHCTESPFALVLNVPTHGIYWNMTVYGTGKYYYSIRIGEYLEEYILQDQLWQLYFRSLSHSNMGLLSQAGGLNYLFGWQEDMVWSSPWAHVARVTKILLTQGRRKGWYGTWTAWLARKRWGESEVEKVQRQTDRRQGKYVHGGPLF